MVRLDVLKVLVILPLLLMTVACADELGDVAGSQPGQAIPTRFGDEAPQVGGQAPQPSGAGQGAGAGTNDEGQGSGGAHGGGAQVPPANPPTGSPAEQGLSCLEIYEAVSDCYDAYYACAAPCQDEACAAPCEQSYNTCYDANLAQGSPTGQGEFQGLRECEETNYQACYDEGGVVFNDCSSSCSDQACADACGAEATAVLQSCMVQACQTHYAQCGVQLTPPSSGASDDPGQGSTPDSGGQPAPSAQGVSCGELYACEDACNGNQTCGQACYDSGTETAKSQWTSLIMCGQAQCDGFVANAAEYKMCLQQFCPDQYGLCFSGGAGGGGSPGPGPGQGSGSTCGEGYQCIQSCYGTSFTEAAFYTCVDGCYDALSPQGYDLMTNLKGCIDVQCANVPGSINNYYQCVEDFCPSQHSACMNQGAGTGGGTPGGAPPTGGALNSCNDIYEAVMGVCVPAYSTCSSACADEPCADACGADFDACMVEQESKAPASAATQFQELTQCRVTHYEACYAQSEDTWNTCVSSCTPGDAACEQTCADSANDTYEGCLQVQCSMEYQTCGLL